jgi:hypothetical protein
MDRMSTAEPTPPAKPSTFRRPRDMFLSLAVLLVPIAAFFLLWNVFADGQQARVIDPGPAFDEAASTGLAVSRPHDLSAQWQAVSSAVASQDGTVTLRVGYQTPQGAGMQLVETDGDAEKLLAAEITDAPRPAGTERIKDRQWQSYAVKGGNALLYSDDELTILVHGDTDVAELISFAETLD